MELFNGLTWGLYITICLQFSAAVLFFLWLNASLAYKIPNNWETFLSILIAWPIVALLSPIAVFTLPYSIFTGSYKATLRAFACAMFTMAINQRKPFDMDAACILLTEAYEAGECSQETYEKFMSAVESNND